MLAGEDELKDGKIIVRDLQRKQQSVIKYEQQALLKEVAK